MSKVSINAPKTPVTEGSSGVAMATMPNICKMPGPPAPFVPTPLPNIGKSGMSPKGYSKKVTIEGKKVAIAGASFGSMGDVASKGLGGGLVSMNCEGPTKFVGPGSLDVQIEGKNVQLLGDPMLNNCGPSGSPPNSATMTGVLQAPNPMVVIYGDDIECPVCTKTHPVQEGLETGAALGAVFKSLGERYEKQKPDIKKIEDFSAELSGLDVDLESDQNAAATLARVAAERNRLWAKLQPVAVLRFDEYGGSFTRGYMVGALVCACLKNKKCLITTSGSSPPGFVASTKGTGFTFVGNTFLPTNSQLLQVQKISPGRYVWSCAAPKLIDAAAGHKPSQMSEIMYNPRGGGPTINFRLITKDKEGKVIKDERKKKSFKANEKIPSCEICQELLPAMLCKATCN
jgi:hypothetical protein